MKYLILLANLLFCINTAVFSKNAPNPPTLREKIGQMLMMGFDGKTISSNSPIVQNIDQYNLGGVILFYRSLRVEGPKNIESPAQVRDLNLALQRYNNSSQHKHKRESLPLLIGLDYEGGKIKRLPEELGFPHTFSAAEIGEKSVEETKLIAGNMAKTLKKFGFNFNFSPVLDLNLNKDNVIIGQLGRSFSDNPNKVTDIGRIFAEAYLKENIQCAYKHFPGHGSSSADSHLGFVDITHSWQEQELVPYRSLTPSTHVMGCGAIMTAHVVNKKLDPSGLPATLSSAILDKLLTKQIGYNGLIVTDDLQMKAISDHYGLEKTLVLAVNAGADILLFGNNLSQPMQHPKEVIDIIESKVKSGEIPLERINTAYQKILAFKQTLNS